MNQSTSGMVSSFGLLNGFTSGSNFNVKTSNFDVPVGVPLTLILELDTAATATRNGAQNGASAQANLTTP